MSELPEEQERMMIAFVLHRADEIQAGGHVCSCAPGCPAKCTPERFCDVRGCGCYELWGVELDEVERANRNTSLEELRARMVEAFVRIGLGG